MFYFEFNIGDIFINYYYNFLVLGEVIKIFFFGFFIFGIILFLMVVFLLMFFKFVNCYYRLSEKIFYKFVRLEKL